MRVSINSSAAINVADEILKGDTMRIKITAENAAKLEEAFDEAHGRVRGIWTTAVPDLMRIAKEGEKKLGEWGLPKSFRKGLRVEHRGSVPMDSGSSRTPVTYLTLERGAADWFLTSVAKVYVRGGVLRGTRYLLTHEMRQEAIRRIFEGTETYGRVA